MKYILIWWNLLTTMAIFFIVLGIAENSKSKPQIKVPVKILKSIESIGFGRCFAVLEDIKIGTEFYTIECIEVDSGKK